MDEKNKLNDEVKPVPKQGSGYLLASRRKKQGRTVEEIADELNLSVTQIRTIELDQSEGLPEPTYVRGYIRAYARLLGMDADTVLEHYLNPNWQRGSRLDDMPRGIGSANEREKSAFFTPGKVVTLIVVLSTIGFLWVSGQLDKMFSSDEPLTTISSDSASSDSAATSNRPSPNDVGFGGESPDEPSEQTVALTENSGEAVTDEGLVAEQADVVPGLDVTSANPAGVENTLRLSFTGTSWIDIRDGEGEKLAYKSYAQGEDLVVKASTPMSVFIGDASAVSAQLNDQNYDISQYREGAFARFTIGE